MISAWWLILIPVAFLLGTEINGFREQELQKRKCERCEKNKKSE